MSLLVIGYGNPARRDDGLGPAFAEEVERLGLGVSVESDYQLSAEDAAVLAEHEVAVLVDASLDGAEPFSFKRLEAEPDWSISAHSLSPGALLALTRASFGYTPECWMLGIRGYNYDFFSEGLTAEARSNLEAALFFFRSWIKDNGHRPATVPPAGKEAI